MPSTYQRITIVLGGGSTLGRSFHAGVLLAMERRLGVDPRTVDTIVGTSSGAIVAGFVGAGLSAGDLFRHELGRGLSPAGSALLSTAEVWRSGRRSLLADAALVGSATGDRTASVGGRLARLIPRGPLRHDVLCSYMDGLHGATWPERPDLRFCAVDVRSGRRVVLDGTAVRSPGPAVAASCALPGIHAPVDIGRYRLVDGAVHSMDNADVATDCDRDLIIVSSPLSADQPLGPWRPLAGLRNTVRSRTQRDLEDHRPDCPVVVVRPETADVRAMGMDLGTNRRRASVARQALATADQAFQSFLASSPAAVGG